MTNYKRIRTCFCLLRNFATQGKPKVLPDEAVLEAIDKNVYKPRNHPGLFKSGTVTVPETYVTAITNVLEDFPVKSLIEDGKVLIHHLKGKRPPIEKDEMKKVKRTVYERVVERTKVPEAQTEEERQKSRQLIDNKVNNILRKEMYNWKPVNYDNYNALVYLMSRSAAEYSVLVKIFLEIAERDPDFKPRSLFDFGSGVGTVTWAASLYWKKFIFEYFNVDSSSEMNDLAQLLLQKGRGTNKIALRGVFYRQFLPASNTSYDLVVSAYTMLELPSQQARLDTVLNLWNKTQKYLVIVEQGTNAGFQVVNEIRDFILYSQNSTTVGHVFSPCPHDAICPRFTLSDGTPCNFESYYLNLPFGGVEQRRQEKYSYIVLKKGERNASDPQWPRVIRDTLVRSKHTICRMCTKNGELEEVIFTASKHGKNLYHCARVTKWGDLVPVSLEKQVNSDNTEDTDGSENEKGSE